MRLTLAAIVAALALLASACLSSGAKPKSKHHTTTGQTQPSQFTPPSGTYIASCVPVVTGGLSSDFLDPDVSVRSGPVVFDRVLANRGDPSDYQPVTPGRYNPAKTLVLLRKGHAALVEVSKSQHHVVSLLFDQSKIAPGQSAAVTDGAPGGRIPQLLHHDIRLDRVPGSVHRRRPTVCAVEVTPLNPARTADRQGGEGQDPVWAQDVRQAELTSA